MYRTICLSDQQFVECFESCDDVVFRHTIVSSIRPLDSASGRMFSIVCVPGKGRCSIRYIFHVLTHNTKHSARSTVQWPNIRNSRVSEEYIVTKFETFDKLLVRQAYRSIHLLFIETKLETFALKCLPMAENSKQSSKRSGNQAKTRYVHQNAFLGTEDKESVTRLVETRKNCHTPVENSKGAVFSARLLLRPRYSQEMSQKPRRKVQEMSQK